MCQAGRVRRRVPLLSLFVANAVSQTGNVMALVAIPWFVLQATGSAALTGVVAFFTTLPAIIAGFFGGTMVDRLGFKKMSVTADVASCVSVALIPLLYGLVGFDVVVLMALVFLGALLDAPGTTARSSLVPDLAAEAGMSLERATATIQAIQRGSNLAGAPIGGLLIAWLGADNVLWVDATTFAVSAGLILLFVPSPPRAATPGPRPGYRAELLAGLRFLRSDRLIFAITTMVMITNFLDAPLFAVVLPVFAREAFGSAVELGAIIGVFGGGALLGSVLYGAFGERLPRRPVFALAFVMVSAPFWVLATLPGLGITLGMAALLGLAAGPINPIISTIAYERIPAALRGRVLGALTAGAYVAIPAGVLVAGLLIEGGGLARTLIVIAASYSTVTVAAGFHPVFRAMERPPT